MYILVTPSVSRPSGNPSLAITSRDNKVKKVEEYSGGRWGMVEGGGGGMLSDIQTHNFVNNFLVFGSEYRVQKWPLIS